MFLLFGSLVKFLRDSTALIYMINISHLIHCYSIDFDKNIHIFYVFLADLQLSFGLVFYKILWPFLSTDVLHGTNRELGF